jgi:hypothetical protein
LADRRRSAFELLRVEQRASARRLIIDGVQWLVYELPARDLDRRSSPSLVFESEDTVRRVRDFPPNWGSLSDGELEKVSWSR